MDPVSRPETCVPMSVPHERVRMSWPAHPTPRRLTALLLILAGTLTVSAQTGAPVGKYQDVSLAQYRDHLRALIQLTQACAKARDLPACDPLLVGLDDRVPLPKGERRLIRYGWLRVLFSHAEDPDQAQQEASNSVPNHPDPTHSIPKTTSQLLADAEARLTRDLAQGVPATPPPHAAARAALEQVLAAREFRGLQAPDNSDSIAEKVNDWLNRMIARLDRWRARSAWVGRALITGFLALVGIALIGGLLRLERRWRFRLTLDRELPTLPVAATRDWQLWLQDARRAAAAGLWRDAIHCLYWASISRLDSRRLWPVDRARTPREYLQLFPAEDPRKTGLSALTRIFERTWYGGRPAAEAEYLQAEQTTASLIGVAPVRPGAPPGGLQ